MCRPTDGRCVVTSSAYTTSSGITSLSAAPSHAGSIGLLLLAAASAAWVPSASRSCSSDTCCRRASIRASCLAASGRNAATSSPSPSVRSPSTYRSANRFWYTMYSLMVVSPIATTVAFCGPSRGGYHGALLPARITRSAWFRYRSDCPPRYIGWLLGKLAYRDALSTTGMANSSDSATRLLNPSTSRPALSVMISGDSLRATISASAAMSSSAGRVFGAPGMVRILSPGVQSWIIVSMGMSRNAGPCGTRCANSPARTNCSYNVCGLVALPLHLVNALANRSGPPTTLRLRYHCACGSISGSSP